MRKLSVLLVVLAIAALLVFWAQKPAQDPGQEPPIEQPMVLPQEPAANLAPATNKVFRVDSDTSRLRVLATPDGPLRRFGHYHVISHHGISGSVEVPPNPLESSFTLEINVGDFVIDDPALRALEGEDYETEVPQKDRDGTKSNMLGEALLNGASFPTIRIQSSAIEGNMPDVNIVTKIAVIGTEQTVRFPASIELTDDSFVASGQLELTHEELGLSPFTAMGGALSVGDLLILKYEISGTRVTTGD